VIFNKIETITCFVRWKFEGIVKRGKILTYHCNLIYKNVISLLVILGKFSCSFLHKNIIRMSLSG